jgi:hypothetical protein
MFCALRLQQKRGWTHFIRLCTNGWQEQDSFTNTIPIILSLWTFRPVPKIASTSPRWGSGVQTEISAWRSTTEDTPQPTFVYPYPAYPDRFFRRGSGLLFRPRLYAEADASNSTSFHRTTPIQTESREGGGTCTTTSIALTPSRAGTDRRKLFEDPSASAVEQASTPTVHLLDPFPRIPNGDLVIGTVVDRASTRAHAVRWTVHSCGTPSRIGDDRCVRSVPFVREQIRSVGPFSF